jgi:DNA-binding CsgD family transcriptional regulator/PAS domain-containing protein
MMRGDFVKGRNHTVSLLYEAAMNPSLWPNALAAFADLTQCRDVVLSVIDKKRGKPRLFLSGCRIFTPEAMRDYLTHYYKVDPLLQSSASTSPAGTLLLCHEFVSPDVAARNESYQDYLIPHGGRYMGGWCLENNEEVLAGFTMQARDAPFERKKVARWGSMAQHARHAVALSLQLAEHMSQIVMMRQAIDSAGVVCIMVDGDSKLIDCSAAAAALLGHGGSLKVSIGDRLATVSATGTKRLRQLVTLAATGGGGGLMRIANAADESFCIIQVVPGGVSTDNPFDPRYAGCALIFVRQPSGTRPVDVRQIRVALDCTQAEAEVAGALVGGNSPTRISVDGGVTITTVRTQIRSLLSLAGVNRTAELVALLASLS